jgi:hypothetical protein
MATALPDPGPGGYTPLPGFQSGTGSDSSAGLPMPPPSGPGLPNIGGPGTPGIIPMAPSSFPGATFAEMLVAFGVLIVITLMLPPKYAVWYPFSCWAPMELHTRKPYRMC